VVTIVEEEDPDPVLSIRFIIFSFLGSLACFISEIFFVVAEMQKMMPLEDTRVEYNYNVVLNLILIVAIFHFI
jgi:hypothetical protein